MLKFENQDIIITTPLIKKIILKQLTHEKKLIKLRFFTPSSFSKKYFGEYSYPAIYYLMKVYHYQYEVAITYLDHLYGNTKLQQELEEQNLIFHDPYFKQSIKRIIIIGPLMIDPYLKKVFDSYPSIYWHTEKSNPLPTIYEHKTLDEEVIFQANAILNALEHTSIENIYLVNMTSEYKEAVRRIFAWYHLPIALEEKKSIFSLPQVQQFLDTLKKTYDIEQAFSKLTNCPYQEEIITICSHYAFREIDSIILECITKELKNLKVKNEVQKNTIHVISFDEITSPEAYYFILGFHQGSIPKIYQDEDFLSDQRKLELGILTSSEKNQLYKQYCLSILKTYPHLNISYKKASPYATFYPSSLIAEFNIPVNTTYVNPYTYSHLANKINLGIMLDKFEKYNEIDTNLNLLLSNYEDIAYHTYDNSFTGLSLHPFYQYLNQKLTLSYSSLDSYYHCGFRYYINEVLKLVPYEESFSKYIGNLFHHILAIAFTPHFDFETAFKEQTKNIQTAKEKFLISRLKSQLRFVIEEIKQQNQMTSLTNEIYEQNIKVKKNKQLEITFTGFLDKIKYQKIDHQTILMIVDYKTGVPNIALDYVPYGLDMQLPIYLYLTKYLEFENPIIGGFYLQKVIHGISNFDPDKNPEEEKKKRLKLEGYSNEDLHILAHVDHNYENSNLIKGMKVSSKGFYPYTKILNHKQIEKLTSFVEDKIEEAENSIIEAKFDINPKRIDGQLKGCEFCQLKDICYRKEEDIITLSTGTKNIFLGSDENA